MKSEVFVVFALVASAFALINPIYDEWEKWKNEYNPKYATNDEHEARFRVFSENHRRVLKLNEEYAGLAHFALGKFADLTPEEFARMYLTPFSSKVSSRYLSSPLMDYPKKKDWREEGAVGPVRDQSSVSVFPFAALDNMESIYKIAHGGDIPTLSQQQLVDCAHTAQMLPEVLDYAVRNGMMSQADYPDSGWGVCKYDSKKATYRYSKYFKVKADEDDMVAALNDVGPLAVGVDARKWQYYSSGIFNLECSTELNHAALIVGYDSTIISGKEVKYWIVKNSWGSAWGEKGYIRLIRGQDECGINNNVYTVVA